MRNSETVDLLNTKIQLFERDAFDIRVFEASSKKMGGEFISALCVVIRDSLKHNWKNIRNPFKRWVLNKRYSIKKLIQKLSDREILLLTKKIYELEKLEDSEQYHYLRYRLKEISLNEYIEILKQKKKLIEELAEVEQTLL